MRDGPLKRFLVQNYFGTLELWSSLTGMFAEPPFQLVEPDYERYWEMRGDGGFHPRFEIIGDLIEPDASVLDIGCGDGTLLAHLQEKKGAKARGIDISEVAAQKARARGVEASQSTLEAFSEASPDLRFAHVILSEIIEHVSDPERLVKSAWAHTEKTLWLTIPNIAYLPHRLRLLAGRFPVQWAIFPGEHLRFWSVPDFTRWLAALGFPKPEFYPSNGVSIVWMHRIWPNLMANQIVVRIDRDGQTGATGELPSG